MFREEKEGLIRKFFSFQGCLDQLGFMVRTCVLALLTIPVINLAANLRSASVNINVETMAFFTVILVVMKLIAGASYISLSLRRLNDIGSVKILVILPLIAIIADLCLTSMGYYANGITQETLSNEIYQQHKSFINLYLYTYTLSSILNKIMIFIFLYFCLKPGVYGGNKYGVDILSRRCELCLEKAADLENNAEPDLNQKTILKRFFSFKGRFSQFQFLWHLSVLYAAYRFAAVIFGYMPNPTLGSGIVYLAVMFFLFIAFLNLCIKRLHDNKRSALFVVFL